MVNGGCGYSHLPEGEKEGREGGREDTLTVERARELRREQTDAERKLWSGLRNRQIDGWKFKRQVPKGAYLVDFCCADATDH